MAATDELAALLSHQERLAARVDDVSLEERSAVATAKAASHALVALERASASGTKVSEAKRREAGDTPFR